MVRAEIRTGLTGASAPAEIRQKVCHTPPQDPLEVENMKNDTLFVAFRHGNLEKYIE